MKTIRAMVMAAGAGTRLRPLTDELPKPMAPIANRPVMEYTLENLKRHGITNIILNLHHHPELIRRHFGDGSRWGVELEYSSEPILMGTAGGVKKASHFFHDHTFLVMSGDGLTDIDLTELIRFHRQRKSIATMALSKVDTKFDYGITLTQPNGRIKNFIEKPRWSDIFSNQVNTGIYVFEPEVLKMIPINKSFDFGHDVWPALLSKKKPIFAHLSDRYWCDVGNFGEYQRAQRDFLDHKTHFKLPGKEIRRGIRAEEGATVATGAKLFGPCLLGRDVHVAAGARLGPYAVIGHGSKIGAGSSLRHTTVWNNVQVQNNVFLENCIVGQNTRLQSGISIFNGIIPAENKMNYARPR